MTELVGFPDAEALCVQSLNSFLTDCKASTKIPNPRPSKLVRVSRTGGIRENVGIESAQLVFESWGPDEITAQQLGAQVRAWVESMPEYGYEIGGLVNNPDPETQNPRYQFSVCLYLAAEVIS